MDSQAFGLLALLTVVVIFVTYRMNLVEQGNKRSSALRKAYWWGGSFFAYGMANYLLLGSVSL